MRRKSGLKMPHFWLSVVLVAVLSVIAVGGTIYAGRTGRNDYVCLRFSSDRLGVDWLLDVNTRFYAYDKRPLESTGTMDVLGKWVSPDSTRIAYLRPTRSITPRFALYVKPMRDGRVSLDDDNGGALIETSINLFGFAWSPDNSRIAYTYRDVNGQAMLTVATPDGKIRKDQQIITPRSNDVLFHGWSADSAYVAISTNEAFGRTVSFWSVPELHLVAFPVYVVMPFIENVSWSPTGRWLAYLRNDASNRTRLVVATPGVDGQPNSSIELKADLPLLQNTRVFWSPDGRHLALRYLNLRMFWQIALYEIKQDRLIKIAEDLTQGSRLLWPQGSIWSDDGRGLVYWREREPARGRDLALYRLDTQTTETLIADVQVGDTDPLMAPEGKGRMAVSWREADGTVSADLMTYDGRERAPLVRGAREISQTSWSPDGKTVLVRWLVRQGVVAQSRLTWARADGSNMRVLEDTNSRIEELRWLDDGKSLVYTARQASDLLAVEIVNLETNERRQLATELQRVENLIQDPSTGHITFWWLNARNEAGVDGYDLSETRLYRYASMIAQAENGQLYKAPQGDIAALLVGPPSMRILHLASPDGKTTRMLRDGIRYGTVPRWTPDGSLLAYNYGENNGTVWRLEIYTASGERIRTFDQFGTQTQSLVWTRCD